jgi:hypothetical protein
VKPELIVLNFFLRPPSSVLMIHQSRRIHFVKSYLVKIMKQSVSSRANKFEQCRNFCNVLLLLLLLRVWLWNATSTSFSLQQCCQPLSQSLSRNRQPARNHLRKRLPLPQPFEKAKYCIHLATLNLICSPLSIC